MGRLAGSPRSRPDRPSLMEAAHVMRKVPPALWVAAVGAVLQIVAIAGNFYELKGAAQSAWFGVPHASDLILASALIALLAVGLTAVDRVPVRARTIGLVVGTVGLLATAQLVYRMEVPPYGCLQFGCGFSAKADVSLLTGIWVALGACVAVTLSGFGYAASTAAKRASIRPIIASEQPGMTPWLGLAAIGVVSMFIFPFTVFTLYTVKGFFGGNATSTWGGWLSLPHTSSLILALATIVVGLVIAAARGRSPLAPRALGVTLAALALIGAARILYRIFVDPFSVAGGAENVQVGSVTTDLVGYLGLAGALLAVVAGIRHALDNPGSRTVRQAETGAPDLS